MELNLMTIWQYKENDERKSKIWAFLVEKKETVDEGKVRVLSDLFCVSCALADTADWGQICFAFNENVTVGLFIGESNGAERLNAVLNNHSRDFPCSYDDLQWYLRQWIRLWILDMILKKKFIILSLDCLGIWRKNIITLFVLISKRICLLRHIQELNLKKEII